MHHRRRRCRSGGSGREAQGWIAFRTGCVLANFADGGRYRCLRRQLAVDRASFPSVGEVSLLLCAPEDVEHVGRLDEVGTGARLQASFVLHGQFFFIVVHHILRGRHITFHMLLRPWSSAWDVWKPPVTVVAHEVRRWLKLVPLDGTSKVLTACDEVLHATTWTWRLGAAPDFLHLFVRQLIFRQLAPRGNTEMVRIQAVLLEVRPAERSVSLALSRAAPGRHGICDVDILGVALLTPARVVLEQPDACNGLGRVEELDKMLCCAHHTSSAIVSRMKLPARGINFACVRHALAVYLTLWHSCEPRFRSPLLAMHPLDPRKPVELVARHTGDRGINIRRHRTTGSRSASSGIFGMLPR
mmetsp:Transcript_39441/g.108635  ORF Transcript_39441/g.108635 Transcript_39441/m.108635 type:complete len:357 (+) Transcript_39441:504-1574(+)